MLRVDALCRMDDALVERLTRGHRLRPVLLTALATIVLGAGVYGAAFGLWRAPEQAVYVALKLPLLLIMLAALTVGLSAMLATLLRSKLTLRQTATCILLSLAVASAVLAALAPLSFFLVANAPPPDAAAVGLPIHHRAVLPSMDTARALLLWHMLVVAGAGLTGVVRLRSLLLRLVDDAVIARRVLFAWIAAQFLVGAELSWLLRPFLGKPHLPPSLLRNEALAGNFFEEVGTLMVSTFGAAAPFVGGLGVVAITAWLVWTFRAPPTSVEAEVTVVGLVLTSGRMSGQVVPWSNVAHVRQSGSKVCVELVEDAALDRETLTLGCADPAAAHALAARLEEARARLFAGPFRTADAAP